MNQPPTMEQCIDRRCMCIGRDHPRGYRGLSPEYQRKLADYQAELQAEYDERQRAFEANCRNFERTMWAWTAGIALAIAGAIVWWLA